VSRATDAGVVRPHEHLTKQSEFIFFLISIKGDQSLKVMLDITVVLVLIGGDNAVRPSDVAPIVIGIVVNEKTSRCLYGSNAPLNFDIGWSGIKEPPPA
jgi:hypothetical protein